MATSLHVRRAVAALVAITLAFLTTNLSTVAAQADANEDDADAPLIGYRPRYRPFPLASEWVEPAVLFDLDPESLEPRPSFDIVTLHDSTVFAAGVDQLRVEDEDLDLHIERHISVLQAIDTLDRDLTRSSTALRVRRSLEERILASIDTHRTEQARLAQEIETFRHAISEMTIRAFVEGEELETALAGVKATTTGNRVITDEVHDDHSHQISTREAEIVGRDKQRSQLERNLAVVRDELEVLRAERSTLLQHRRDAEALVLQTKASYQMALHDRLPMFVAGTDIPLVALNAYVIAERVLAGERPDCRIEWWMLAGVGKVESAHGHFANSTLNRNGHTTELIRGPALDGRILEGAEFLKDGAVLAEAEVSTSSMPAPATGTAANAQPSSSSEVPVVKRLALITDTDGGVLDRDTVYDRAVGPMQFIPQTWRTHKADGNLDENFDPQNIYDAALASARYLCEATSTMATVEGRDVAFFAYNHDTEYSANVAAAAAHYRAILDLPSEHYGTATALGIADPQHRTLAGRVAVAIRELNLQTLPDWHYQ